MEFNPTMWVDIPRSLLPKIKSSKIVIPRQLAARLFIR